MKTVEKYLSHLILILIIAALSFSLNLYAQDRGDHKHHDNGRHEGWYKKEDRNRHDDREEHYRRDNRYERNVRVVRRDDRLYRRYRYDNRDYFFRDGIFYKWRDRDYVVVTPPIGLRISFLPQGYRVIYHRRLRYYFFGGIYYRFLPGVRMFVVVKTPF